MIVDCERCPGQHLSPPACPSCVVRLLLDPAAGPRTGPPPPAPVVHPDARPVPVALVRRTDDLGRPLDAAEQRAVALLTSGGLLSGAGRGPRGRRRSVRTA